MKYTRIGLISIYVLFNKGILLKYLILDVKILLSIQ